MSIRRLLKRLTQDRNRDPPALHEIHTTEQIGPRRSLTPEGFLLCEAVPIARVGVMMYGPDEVPVEEGPDGVIWISRTADTLFRPETIASFVGKPVVDEHPEDDVTPDNWMKLTRGITLNVRPGEGEDADVLLADLLITDAQMIRDINAMKREVSAGYEADYEQTAPGQGDQTEIIGNHVALVERGRCGPRCAIGDSHATTRKHEMATQVTKQRTSIPPRRRISQATLDAITDLVGKDPDASTMDDGELSGPADSHTHIHIHGMGTTANPSPKGEGAVDVKDDETTGGTEGNGSTLDPKTEARFASLENGHKEIIAQLAALTKALSGEGGSGGEDPSGTTGDSKEDTDDENPFAKKDDEDKDKEKKDDKSKTNDSAALETSYKDVLSGCEVLVPGFRMPTFDSKAKRAVTIDTMCNARRKALDAFGLTSEGLQVITTVAGVKTVDTISMACPAVATLFRAVVGAKKLVNNGNATRDAGRMGQAAQEPGKKVGAMSLADWNKANREHYAKQTQR
jgi:hypothetical protein